VRSASTVLVAIAVLLAGTAVAARAEPLGSLRFFAEPGPPPPAGEPDPIVGGCLSSYPGDAAIGTTPCGSAPGLTTAAAVALSGDGRHAYVASSTSDAVTAYARDERSGRLTHLDGGCLSQTARAGCTTANGLDGAQGVAVSPDGTRVYVGSLVSDAVAIFTRDPGTGLLSQRSGDAGCLSEGGVGGCRAARGLDHVAGIAVAPDSQTVYAAGRGSDAVAVLKRTDDGLEQPSGPEGCLHDAVTSDSGLAGCTGARGLDGAYGLTLHGDTLYAASRVSDAIAVLRREDGGTLVQLAGADGCVAHAALADCAVTGRGLDGVTAVAVAPDGAHAYSAAYASYAVTAFSRDGASGRLAALGCLSEERETASCTPARGLLYAHAVAVSPDGRSVYAAGQYSSALSVLQRRADTGSLVQEPPADGRTWSEGCISWRGHRWSRETDLSAADHSDHYCARSLGLYYPSDVAVSGDGRNVYATAARSHTVTTFTRFTEGTLVPSEPAPGSASPPPMPEPPPEPGSQPSATAAEPPPYTTPPDRTPPFVSVAVPRRARLSALRRAGLLLRIGVREPATVDLRLSIAASSRTVARATVAVASSRLVRLRLNARGRAALRRARGRAVPLRLTAVASDAAGNRSTPRIRRVVVSRPRTPSLH
jgi:DNA-binding beta-propeller fold protein YncE